MHTPAIGVKIWEMGGAGSGGIWGGSRGENRGVSMGSNKVKNSKNMGKGTMVPKENAKQRIDE